MRTHIYKYLLFFIAFWGNFSSCQILEFRVDLNNINLDIIRKIKESTSDHHVILYSEHSVPDAKLHIQDHFFNAHYTTNIKVNIKQCKSLIFDLNKNLLSLKSIFIETLADKIEGTLTIAPPTLEVIITAPNCKNIDDLHIQSATRAANVPHGMVFIYSDSLSITSRFLKKIDFISVLRLSAKKLSIIGESKSDSIFINNLSITSEIINSNNIFLSSENIRMTSGSIKTFYHLIDPTIFSTPSIQFSYTGAVVDLNLSKIPRSYRSVSLSGINLNLHGDINGFNYLTNFSIANAYLHRSSILTLPNYSITKLVYLPHNNRKLNKMETNNFKSLTKIYTKRILLWAKLTDEVEIFYYENLHQRIK